MAFNLLKARDAKLFDKMNGQYLQSDKQDSVIATLADELAKHDHIKRYFPVASKQSAPGSDSGIEDEGATIELQEINRKSIPKHFTDINDTISEYHAAEYESEALRNPFYVAKNK